MTSLPRTIVVDVATGPTAAAVDTIAGVFEQGGVVVVPTDTVYGVAARLGCAEAIDRLFALKQRDRSQAVAVLAADADQAVGSWDLSGLPSDAVALVHQLVAEAWPGALTLVAPRAAHLRGIDLGGDPTTIGVRVPDSTIVRRVAARVGPLATTSGNRSGAPTPTDAATAAAGLAGAVDLVVDAGGCGGEPSTVLDVGVWPPRVLRQGPYRLPEVVTCGV